MTLIERPLTGQVARGREPERRVVDDLLQRAQRGYGGVVLVDGEPGSGKSLLLRDAVNEAAQRGFSLIAGAADQMGHAFPFFALRAGMRRPLAGARPDGPDRALADVTAWWTIRIRAHLERRAATAPVLICLDDLHCSGPGTLAALRALPRDLKQHSIAWLLARSNTPQRVARQLFGLLEKDGAALVTLPPLDQAAVADMLTDAFGAPPDLALAELVGGAAGNPGLVTELIAGLREDRAVQVANRVAVLSSSRLPQRVHRLAQRRLDDLSAGGRQLLVTAAVLGPEFRLEDAAVLLGETPATLLPFVEETMDAAIMAADDEFTFRHQLIRRAIGELIPQPARRALHRQYGEMLLARGESADRAADHLLRAADPADRESLARLDDAAARTRSSAPQTTADLTLRALELTPRTDPEMLARTVAAVEALTAAGRLDRAAQTAQDTLALPLQPAAEDRLRCALSSALYAAGQPGEAAAQAKAVLARPRLAGDLRDLAQIAYLQALTGLRDKLARREADTVLAARHHISGPVAAAALVTRAVISWDSGQVSDSLGQLRDAARHSAGSSPDARHVQPLLGLGSALIDLRQLQDAEDILRAADHPAFRHIPAGAVLALLHGRIHLAAGRFADAAAAAQAALATANALSAHTDAVAAHSVLAAIELRHGDIAAAAQHLAGRPTASPRFADSYAGPETALIGAQVIEARDGAVAAVGQLRELCADLPVRPGLLLGDPAVAAWLARTAVAAGNNELADTVARTARALADANPGFPALVAAAAHSRGVAYRDPGCLAEAAVQHPDLWARASAAEDLGDLHSRYGDRDQAVGYLKVALDGYRQVGAKRDQARIRSRLRELGVRNRHWTTPPAGPVTGWGSLTETEKSVAGLVAEGLNNKQVAARMYISPHTVAHYLRQAFRKLSITSRVELTRIVIEQAADNT